MAIKSLGSIKPDVRRLADMKMVIFDQAWAKKAPNFELYYMYRGVDKKNGLQCNITVIPPRMLGEEFTKTMGHDHPKNYGEVYVVLSGEAIFLFQRYRNGEVEDVCAVKAKKGEAVIIPPDHGHVTINPSKKQELKTADWSDERRYNIYDRFIEKQGAAFYYTKGGWIKNKRYGRIPKLRFAKPLGALPKNLDFLLHDK